ncbi:MAG: hypothetical protein ABI847_11600 [Anaerolineales bacterium]
MKRLAAQLIGIAGTELRQQWRRRGLVTLMAGLVVLMFLVPVIVSRSGRSISVTAGGAPAPRMSQSTMSGTWLAALLVITLFLPILASETLPLDRQNGVRELLESLPVSPAVLLLGRLLGLWAGVLGCLAVVALADGLLGRWWHGPLDLGRYAALWLGSLAPAALLLSAAGMLLAAPLPGRRGAALLGIAVGVFNFFGQAAALNLGLTLLTALWPPFFLHQLVIVMSGLLETDFRAQMAALGNSVQYYGAGPWEGLLPVPVLCVLGPLQLLVPVLVAGLWLRWRATR